MTTEQDAEPAVELSVNTDTATDTTSEEHSQIVEGEAGGKGELQVVRAPTTDENSQVPAETDVESSPQPSEGELTEVDAVEVDSQQDNSDSARDETARRGTSRQRPNPTSADSPNPAAAANPTADVELSAVETTEIAKGNSTAQPTLDSATPSASVEQSPNGKIAQSLIGKSVQRGSGEGIKLQGAEQARLINRVARAMTSAREQGAPLRIRLSPPELGSIRLEVKVQDGAMSARIEAETPAARAALLENVSDLRQRLAEQGIRVEQFDVDLTDRQNGSELPENTNKETDERPQNQDGNEARNESERTTNEEQASSRPEIQGDSKLNVII